MSAAWITIAVLAVATALIRAGGPVLLGGSELHPRLMGVIALLAPALLAALVVVQTVGAPEGSEIAADARLAGVAAAAIALAARRSVLLTVFAAALVTAVVRAVFGG